MKRQRKTPNGQRRMRNMEWRSNGLKVADETDRVYGGRGEYDLEDRLLEFAATIVEPVDSLPSSRAANHIAGQLLRCRTQSCSDSEFGVRR